MKRQLLQNYILKKNYISNFTKSIRKDILKLTNIASITKAPNPQPTAIGWGFGLRRLIFYYVVLAKNLNNATQHSIKIDTVI
jgi:hypothetical protein